jgi:hypothetical protein
MKFRPWTQTELQRAIKLYAAGSPYADIARALDRSEAALRAKLVTLESVRPRRQEEARR